MAIGINADRNGGSAVVSVCKENEQKVAGAAAAAVQLNAITHLNKRTASQTT